MIRLCKKCGRNFWKLKTKNNLCPICDPDSEEDCEDDMGKGKRDRAKRKKQQRFQRRIPVTTGDKTNSNLPAKTETSKVTTGGDFDEAWETEIDSVSACGKAPKEITIWMMPLVKEQIEALMKEYKNIEWLAYLLGKWEDENTPVVSELFVPDQRVSAGSVTDISCPEHNDLPIIGVIHSHHTMGHHFSKTDEDWINQNHNISIVVSHTGMKGQVRWKTPCGAMMLVDAKTKLWYDLKFDAKDFIDKAKAKIKRFASTVVYPTGGYLNDDGFYGGGYGVRNRCGMGGQGWNDRWKNPKTGLNDSQKQYTNGKSVKDVTEKSNTTVDNKTPINSGVREVSDEELEDIPTENDTDMWETDGGQASTEELDFGDETLADALAAYEEQLKK